MDIGGGKCSLGSRDDDLIEPAYVVTGGVEPMNRRLLVSVDSNCVMFIALGPERCRQVDLRRAARAA